MSSKSGVVAHACNHSMQETEAGGSWVWGQLGICADTFSQKKEKKSISRAGFFCDSLAPRWPPSPFVLSWPFLLCALCPWCPLCVQSPSSYKDTSHIGLGPTLQHLFHTSMVTKSLFTNFSIKHSKYRKKQQQNWEKNPRWQGASCHISLGKAMHSNWAFLSLAFVPSDPQE
jgi:hypothetical protein